jgi:hypothetical protein
MMMPNMMAQAMPGMMPGYGAPQGYGAPPPLPPPLAFHVALNGAQQGPFDQNAMRSLQGFTPTTLVWRQGMAGWMPAKDVPELAQLFASAGPPPLPTGAFGPPPVPPPV